MQRTSSRGVLLLLLLSLLSFCCWTSCSFESPGLRALGDQGQQGDQGGADGPLADFRPAEWGARSDGALDRGTSAPGLTLYFRNKERERLEDFVVPVFLTPDRFDYQVGAPDGSDLVFLDDDGETVLPHEIERWAPEGTSCVWVRVPLVEGASDQDFISLHYGQAGTSELSASAVWQGSFHAVYHLSDDLAQTGAQVIDSSANGFNGELADDEAATRSAEGQLAGALAFAGEKDGHVLIDSQPELDVAPGETVTLEAWFWADDQQQERTLLHKEYFCQGWSLVLLESGLVMLRFASGNGCAVGQQLDVHLFSGELPLNDNQWHYLGAVLDRDQGQAMLCLDDVFCETKPLEGELSAENDGSVKIGNNWNDTTPFRGRIDEVRIGSRARSVDWFAAQYAAGQDRLLRYVQR